MMQPVFRFAPSPNGALHLGHALSALINFEAAKRLDGRFLLRIEDIDRVRCTPLRIEQMLEDLRWLGLEWEEPVLRQSNRFGHYQTMLQRLKEDGLLFPSLASRKDIRQAIERQQAQSGAPWPSDPDGAPLFPRSLLSHLEKQDNDAAWRIDMAKAIATQPRSLGQSIAQSPDQSQTWQETGPLSGAYPEAAPVMAEPLLWGDVILSRKDCPTSYHLSVVVDDAAQGISHVVRGQDLFKATSIHRLLQRLLGLPAPLYHHHRLLTDIAGRKLAKSRGDLSLRSLRADGVTPDDIRNMIKWTEHDLLAFNSRSSRAR